jgi:hypothetical protein
MSRRWKILLVGALTVLIFGFSACSGPTNNPLPSPSPLPPPVVVVPPPPVRSATPCAVTAKACVVLSDRQAWLTDGAGHITFGPVATRGGTTKYPTPTGTFHVMSKKRLHHSREFNAPMPYSVFFYPGDAFHTGAIGAASHGCLHLTSSSAQRFFNDLQVGDEVEIQS